MDPKIVAILHDAFKKTLDDPKVQEVLAKLELVPAYKSGVDYKKALAETMETERMIMIELGMVKKE